MCGRNPLFIDQADLEARFDAEVVADGGYTPRYNIAPGDDETTSCVTILTTEPNDLMNSIHDRMPVVLPKDAESDWLAADPDTRKELCQPYPNFKLSGGLNSPYIERQVFCFNPDTDENLLKCLGEAFNAGDSVFTSDLTTGNEELDDRE